MKTQTIAEAREADLAKAKIAALDAKIAALDAEIAALDAEITECCDKAEPPKPPPAPTLETDMKTALKTLAADVRAAQVAFDAAKFALFTAKTAAQVAFDAYRSGRGERPPT